MRVGLVGLGRMGAAISDRLHRHGFDLIGWDHNQQVTAALSSRGLPIAENAREIAARSDVVISIVTADDGVRRIFNGPEGMLAGDVSGRLFIEMSTLQPMTARELLPLVQSAGAALIDSPVLGTIPQVQDGKLVALVGGSPADLERGRSVLESLTRRIAHMGPNGAGYAMKLAVNLGLASYIQALSESLALGAGQGLALEQMLDILQEAPYASGWLKSKIGALMGDKPAVTLDLRTLRKDVMSAVATGALTGVPMPLAAGTLSSLSAAVASGYGGADLGELAGFLRQCMVQDFT